MALLVAGLLLGVAFAQCLFGARHGPVWATWLLLGLYCIVWLRWCAWYRGSQPTSWDLALEAVAVVGSFFVSTDARVATVVYAGIWYRPLFLQHRAVAVSLSAYAAAIAAGATIGAGHTLFSPDVLMHLPRMVITTLGLYVFISIIRRQQSLLAEQTRLTEQLAHQAFHDGLTGLPNRALFYERVELACSESMRSDTLTAVMFIDLDNFKGINDTLGHRYGDETIVAAGQRVRSAVRLGDTVARLGGDEFAVLLEALPDRDTALAVAARVGESLSRPMPIAGQTWVLSASIGIAYADQPSSDAGSLVRQADLAMYAAKHAGGGRCVVYDQAGDVPQQMQELAGVGGLRRGLRQRLRVVS
ncbi:MAG: hypothetical protein DCC58_03950 [Chloroflexi bacterium]|nr:MAG: hypothetical protein DCC58_03950 [Chloroflexota bacterium]